MKYGNLNILDNAMYDVMGLGAIVIRLDSGDKPFRYADSCLLHVSGAEYNVPANTHEYGLGTAIVTAMGTGKDSAKVRKALQSVGEEPGVKILGIKLQSTPWTNHHAIVISDTPRGCARNRIDYIRSGGLDQAIKPGMLDYDKIFDKGVKWVHSGGLYSALAPHNPDVIIEFFKQARDRGAVVSFDLNYRGDLWKYHGGQEAAITAMKRIMPYVNVLFGNESDTANALGIKSDVKPVNDVDPAPFRDVEPRVRKEYPNLQVIVTSLRHEFDNDKHLWGAIASYEGKIYEVPAEEISVNCRIGGGDGLAGGIITAILKGLSFEDALRRGWASGKLVASYRGDISLATWEDVEDIARGEHKVKR